MFAHAAWALQLFGHSMDEDHSGACAGRHRRRDCNRVPRICICEDRVSADGHPFCDLDRIGDGHAAVRPARVALIGGHLLATAIGFLNVKFAGPRRPRPGRWRSASLSSHPPPGIDPLDVVINNMSWGFFSLR
jgi:hypothetical protein